MESGLILDEGLRNATITHTGNAIMVMFREKDSLSLDFKKTFSIRMQEPVCFSFKDQTGFKQEWWFKGNNHNPHGGAAIQTIIDTDYFEQHHVADGTLGCDYGPATINMESSI